MTGVRLAGEAEVDAVGAMVARAFQDDPLMAHMLPGAADRERLLPAHLTAFVRTIWNDGEVWVTDDLAAAAAWRRPGERDLTKEQVAASGLDQIPALVGADAWARLSGVFDHLDPRVAAYGLPDHWYLTMLGTEPGRTRAGLGSAVLAPVLADADEMRVPCCLETFTPGNVPFYARHRFAVLEHDVEPSSRLPYWVMVREPR